MTQPAPPKLTQTRLTEVPPALITAQMSDPRLAKHMPLLTGVWDPSTTTAFVANKEAAWQRDGLGHWAFWADGAYVGWGGLQKEGADWDFGLVLSPGHFGLGPRLTRWVLADSVANPRIPYVTFLLPPTRTKLAALKRLGAVYIETITHNGAVFQKFRIETLTLPAVK